MGLQFEQKGAHRTRRQFGPTADSVVTNGEAATTLTLDAYETKITTGGSGGAEDVALPDGEYPGQRKLVTLAKISEGGDKIDVKLDNVVATSVSLDEEGEFVLFEWSGEEWFVLYGTADITLPQE